MEDNLNFLKLKKTSIFKKGKTTSKPKLILGLAKPSKILLMFKGQEKIIHTNYPSVPHISQGHGHCSTLQSALTGLQRLGSDAGSRVDQYRLFETNTIPIH
jgi:hypothetical protein